MVVKIAAFAGVVAVAAVAALAVLAAPVAALVLVAAAAVAVAIAVALSAFLMLLSPSFCAWCLVTFCCSSCRCPDPVHIDMRAAADEVCPG